jgi:hypothetical protein
MMADWYGINRAKTSALDNTTVGKKNQVSSEKKLQNRAMFFCVGHPFSLAARSRGAGRTITRPVWSFITV